MRCVDSCTESGVNPCTKVTEHLMPDGLDVLFEVMRWFAVVMGVIPHILKVDVDSPSDACQWPRRIDGLLILPFCIRVTSSWLVTWQCRLALQSACSHGTGLELLSFAHLVFC